MDKKFQTLALLLSGMNVSVNTGLLILLVFMSVPSSFLLVSERAVISRLPTTDDATMSLDMSLPISSLHNVRALGYDVVNDFVYWVDGRSKSIRRVRNDGTRVCQPPDSPVCTKSVISALTL